MRKFFSFPFSFRKKGSAQKSSKAFGSFLSYLREITPTSDHMPISPWSRKTTVRYEQEWQLMIRNAFNDGDLTKGLVIFKDLMQHFTIIRSSPDERIQQSYQSKIKNLCYAVADILCTKRDFRAKWRFKKFNVAEALYIWGQEQWREVFFVEPGAINNLTNALTNTLTPPSPASSLNFGMPLDLQTESVSLTRSPSLQPPSPQPTLLTPRRDSASPFSSPRLDFSESMLAVPRLNPSPASSAPTSPVLTYATQPLNTLNTNSYANSSFSPSASSLKRKLQARTSSTSATEREQGWGARSSFNSVINRRTAAMDNFRPCDFKQAQQDYLFNIERLKRSRSSSPAKSEQSGFVPEKRQKLLVR